MDTICKQIFIMSKNNIELQGKSFFVIEDEVKDAVNNELFKHNWLNEEYEPYEIFLLSEVIDIPGLLTKLGFYKSKTAARAAGRDGKFIPGWMDKFKATKLNYIYIFYLTKELYNSYIIPRNMDYCYEILNVGDDTGIIKVKYCPFWKRMPFFPEQENGYCTLYKVTDWDKDRCNMLWDGVKLEECVFDCIEDLRIIENIQMRIL